MGLGGDEAAGAAFDVGPSALGQLADGDEAGRAFHEGQHAGAGLTGAEHGVAIPVPDDGAGSGRGGRPAMGRLPASRPRLS